MLNDPPTEQSMLPGTLRPSIPHTLFSLKEAGQVKLEKAHDSVLLQCLLCLTAAHHNSKI